jgi:hypothetical protein
MLEEVKRRLFSLIIEASKPKYQRQLTARHIGYEVCVLYLNLAPSMSSPYQSIHHRVLINAEHQVAVRNKVLRA